MKMREFPGSPVDSALSLSGPRFDPVGGTKILQAERNYDIYILKIYIYINIYFIAYIYIYEKMSVLN